VARAAKALPDRAADNVDRVVPAAAAAA